ncbi:GDP-L-fucose synthase family protein [Mycolicibacterium confluentis]|nr:GDP-L-fucose synthase [Mycolicibacterium confluentis]
MDTRIFITGHRGLVGSALWRHFSAQGHRQLIGQSSSELDLRDAVATAEFFHRTRPQIVICAAARVGGIAANAESPADFISDNLRIQVNVLDSAVSTGVDKVLFLGSSCIYPKFAPQPLREDSLMTGALEPTNCAYAVAKIAGLTQVTAIRHQYRLPYISAMPSNVYGPNDNFDPHTSHVVPAMIRRFHDAVVRGADTVTCWGTGQARREFLFADDLADACAFLVANYDDDSPINVGTGTDVTVAELACTVASVVGFRGDIRWDCGRPDGTPVKRLDVSRLQALGWTTRTDLAQGIKDTYEWFVAHQDSYRGRSVHAEGPSS